MADSPSVAIIGASADRTKYGNKSVRAHQQQGYTVFPINPKGGQVEGLTAFATLADIPAAELPGGRLTRVSLYVPPAVGLKLLPEIAARGCDELWFNPGSESDELIAAAQELGLNTIIACSIVDLGDSPANYSE